MRWSGIILLGVLITGPSVIVHANPGDVENSHDYPGFTRPSGFIITDYTEDNPATFDFTIARPQAIDSGHLDTIHVTGHRYIIRYAPATGNPALSLIQTQRYYEGLAAAAGYGFEKTGDTGDVNETYLLRKPGRSVWVSLEPGATGYVLTVMETVDTPPPPVVVAAPSPPPPAPIQAQAPAPTPVPVPAIGPTLPPAPIPTSPAVPPSDAGRRTTFITGWSRIPGLCCPFRFCPASPILITRTSQSSIMSSP